MTVKLPDGFTAIRFPGYFWNIEEQKLYSLKIDGVLKPLKLNASNRFTKAFHGPFYEISHKGKRHTIPEFTLKAFLKTRDSTIPRRN